MQDRRYTLSDFDYALPPGAHRAGARGDAQRRAACSTSTADALVDRRFVDLPSLLREGDLVILNDTRVIRARAYGTKPSGGRVEMLIERIVADDEAWVQLNASHLPKPGGTVELRGGVTAEVVERDDRFFRLRFRGRGQARRVARAARRGSAAALHHARRRGRTRSATRRSTRSIRARSRRRLRDCISTKRRSQRSRRAASSTPS